MAANKWNINGSAQQVLQRFNECFAVGSWICFKCEDGLLWRVRVVSAATINEYETAVFVGSTDGDEELLDCERVIGAAPSDEQLNDALYREHAHRNPSREAKAKLRELRQETYRLAKWIKANVPAGRHQAVAQTKLDEARMWAANALTLDGEILEDISQSGPTA